MKVYRITNANGDFVTGTLTELGNAKDFAEQFHRRDGEHYHVLAIEHVYTTSVLKEEGERDLLGKHSRLNRRNS